MTDDVSALDRYPTVSIGLAVAAGVALATSSYVWTDEGVSTVAAD